MEEMKAQWSAPLEEALAPPMVTNTSEILATTWENLFTFPITFFVYAITKRPQP